MLQTIRFKNTSADTLKLDSVGLGLLKPGEEVDVPLELAAPGRTDGGQRAKSVIECVAPQLKPVSAEDREIWESVPAPPVPQSKVVTVAARVRDEAPGVKALREAKAKQEAAKAPAEPVGAKK